MTTMTAKRNPKYLAWIRSKPCLICGQKSVAAHVRKQCWGAGVGIRPHDYVAINLCRTHHSELDELYGFVGFEEIHKIDIKRVIIDNLIKWVTK